MAKLFQNFSFRRNASPAAASNKPKSIRSSVSQFGEKRLLKESKMQDQILMKLVSSRITSPENLFRWEANLIGPANCPFENGVFAVSIHIPTKYPFKPPKIMFQTKIFHPNINEDGEISIDILGALWSPSLRIDLLLLSICSVLSTPAEPFIPGNPAVKLYQQDRRAYEKIARMWTMAYAKEA
ncbi:unnamed protein product [Eruca vesicaria subsp. sativa]|uniref:UBC core domain-containing protein n=1 Tax=Eruca vesicaria subsp. sativa TaxID=29727 RepID=A0ABC8LIK0_ERUVS|nr:unnamed protein product [Eruca vesicaria subsp. sativa]